jgi:hypothetical protein
MSDMWRLGMEHSETGHPAPFPVTLPTRDLVATGRLVLDPFMGSGTTLAPRRTSVAALSASRSRSATARSRRSASGKRFWTSDDGGDDGDSWYWLNPVEPSDA